MFDDEFRYFTNLFFRRVTRKEIRLITSDLLEAELTNAPSRVSDFYRSLPKEQIDFVSATRDSDALAELYVAENVVGLTSLTDCQHIAIATLNKADVLASWNFQHIVNLKKIRGYNSVNLKAGLHTVEIRSPKELMEL